MKFKINRKGIMKFRLLIIPIFIFILFACATTPKKTYEETVSEWKSYKDVARWMDRHFSYDWARLRALKEMHKGVSTWPRSPAETFTIRSGVCFDAAVFAKETLNRIDPFYEAKIVFLQLQPYSDVNHYVCSFKKDGKLYIMDYGIDTPSVRGVHGPFNTLEEYKKYWEKWHPRIKHVQDIYYWLIF